MSKKKLKMGIIVIKLIPLLVGSNRSPETPKKLAAVLSMKKLGFRATPFYLCFSLLEKTKTGLRKRVETYLRTLKCVASSH